MNHLMIDSILQPCKEPFRIPVDGSSQTDLNNHGRFGFFIERLFDIKPNCSREPDLNGVELKTVQTGKKVTIGTMTDAEYTSINGRKLHYFKTSEPYRKMKNTLFVFYKKIGHDPEPTYIMEGWNLFSLDNLSTKMIKILQEDYTFICEAIKQCSSSRDDLTETIMEDGSFSGDYLTLSYKGDGKYNYGYNYPSWSFKSSFLRDLQNA